LDLATYTPDDCDLNHSVYQRIVGHLLSNALRATTQGYVAVTVEDVTQVNTLPAGYDSPMTTSIVTITIEDTGCGMSPEFVDRMLATPFTKADEFKVCVAGVRSPSWNADFLLPFCRLEPASVSH
jgi:signal transduction histidine kinase